MKGQNFEIIKNLDGFAKQRELYKNFLFNKFKDIADIIPKEADDYDIVKGLNNDNTLENLFNDWIIVSNLSIELREIHHKNNMRKEYMEINPDIGQSFFITQPVSKLEVLVEIVKDQSHTF